MENINLWGYITELGGKKGKYFKRKHYIPYDDTWLEKCQAFILDYNNTDIYSCIYMYENNDIDNCRMMADMYLDFDGEINTEESYRTIQHEVMRCCNYLETFWGIPRDMPHLFFSGNKGFHLLIPYEILGIQPDAELNKKFKMMAMLIAADCKCSHVDVGIYDRKRLFRLVNSINAKSGLYKVPITYNQLQDFTREEMLSWASEQRTITSEVSAHYIKTAAEKFIEVSTVKTPAKKEKKPFVFPKERKALLPCTLEILKQGVTEGQRNNTTVALASSLMQSGVLRSEVEEILFEWNESNEPPLSETEVNATITSAHTMLSMGMKYGCEKFIELGYCIGKECKLKK